MGQFSVFHFKNFTPLHDFHGSNWKRSLSRWGSHSTTEHRIPTVGSDIYWKSKWGCKKRFHAPLRSSNASSIQSVFWNPPSGQLLWVQCFAFPRFFNTLNLTPVPKRQEWAKYAVADSFPTWGATYQWKARSTRKLIWRLLADCGLSHIFVGESADTQHVAL